MARRVEYAGNLPRVIICTLRCWKIIRRRWVLLRDAHWMTQSTAIIPGDSHAERREASLSWVDAMDDWQNETYSSEDAADECHQFECLHDAERDDNQASAHSYAHISSRHAAGIPVDTQEKCTLHRVCAKERDGDCQPLPPWQQTIHSPKTLRWVDESLKQIHYQMFVEHIDELSVFGHMSIKDKATEGTDLFSVTSFHDNEMYWVAIIECHPCGQWQQLALPHEWGFCDGLSASTSIRPTASSSAASSQPGWSYIAYDIAAATSTSTLCSASWSLLKPSSSNLTLTFLSD